MDCKKYLLVFLTGLFISHSANAVYETNIDTASTWLASQQNLDGSWGSGDSLKFIYTVEAVEAFRSIGLRNDAYYQGITWLENHATNNADYQARRALTLNAHGDNVIDVIAQLESAQNIAVMGRDAWGVSVEYLQSPVDTAVVTRALSIIGTSADLQAAIDYLKAIQLTGAGDQGWPVALETNTDPFSTAMVVKALVALQSIDPTVSTNISNGVSTLGTLVNTGSPIDLQAHTAHAAFLAGNNAIADPLLTNLASTQGGDGSWGSNIYNTALVMRAFAAADGLDTAANQSDVVIPDANLRAVINEALGRNIMDTIDRAELLRLTDLVAVNRGIDDLTGLEFALNLVTADLQNNNITDDTPLNGLPNLVTVNLDGNPVANMGDDGFDDDIPTLPEWGMIIMACLLLWQVIKRQRENDNNDSGLAA